MKTPTIEQIKSEIKALEAIKPNIIPMSIFGDNHHDAIDAQIRVLKEEMDEDTVYDTWEDTNDYDVNRNVINAALDAVNWLDGNSDYEGVSPARDWEQLLKK